MDIYERIETNRAKIASIYDLAAICYDYLRIQIDNQALFLAEYTEYSEGAKQNNPNIRMLKSFSYEMQKLFLQKDVKYSLDEVIEETSRRIASVKDQLISYGTEICNEATIAYYLLQAVDLYTENKPAESSAAPLNEKYRDNSYIYRIHGEAMITKAAVELEFRDKIRTTEIRHNFKCIKMQEKIGCYLTETYLKTPNRMQSLFLVVAGSGWTEENNNVAKIYSYSGKLLGEQYKYSPYDGLDENGERWIEGLRSPGKESVIIDIPGMGSMMTAICRDVSNRDQTEKIADIFEIDFLLVAAWSKSLHGGFDRQLGNITEMNMVTSSLVCNCCAAVDESSFEKGVVVTPCKKKSIIQAKIKIIQNKAQQCEDCDGCIFSIPLSYNTQDVAEGKIVGRIRQIRL